MEQDQLDVTEVLNQYGTATAQYLREILCIDFARIKSALRVLIRRGVVSINDNHEYFITE